MPLSAAEQAAMLSTFTAEQRAQLAQMFRALERRIEALDQQSADPKE